MAEDSPWSKEYRRAVEQLYYWLRGSDTSFSAKLYDLIAKADGQNKYRLALGFPRYVEAYNEWQASEDEDEFFKKWNVAGPE